MPHSFDSMKSQIADTAGVIRWSSSELSAVAASPLVLNLPKIPKDHAVWEMLVPEAGSIGQSWRAIFSA
jgi:hypothetical protein